ncbi:MAG TPA: hypothetical protein VFA78_03800 [Chloroflexota bacterium]|nr:hypothetical protein [Chloroflexota bacterium]
MGAGRLLVVAGQWDAAARALVARWAAYSAALLTPRDLAQPGWRYEPGNAIASRAVVGGEALAAADIAGVLTRLPWITAPELPWIVPEDRAYVAAELNAFLLAWLSELPCPVLNRPTPLGLAGPAWSRGRWVQLAAACGLALAPHEDGGPRPPLPVRARVTVVAGRAIGAVAPDLAAGAVRLAGAAGAEVLTVHFGGPERGACFVTADPRADGARDEVADATLAALLGGRPRATRVAASPTATYLGLPPRSPVHGAGFGLAVRDRAARARRRRRDAGLTLVWGLPGDGPTAAVLAALRGRRAPVVFVDQRDVLATEVRLDIGAPGGGTIRTRAEEIVLGEVTAAYLRPHDARRLPVLAAAGPESDAWRRSARAEERLSTWADLTPAPVVNRPAAMASNGSKPYQAARIRAAGFATPATLITTDGAGAEAFWAEQGSAVYKSLSGVRSIVARLTPEHRPRLADLRWCPTQFQAYVTGTDYRVHVVGDALFACAIESVADDYRYAARQGADVAIRPAALPPDIAARCLMLARALDLPVAGIDLRRTPDGAWFCFEVNPSPGFTFYADATGQPIAAAVADLLIAGERG